MAEKSPVRLSVEERTARGLAARQAVPPAAHAHWTPENGRPDPVGLLESQNHTRDPDLVPLRHGRMMVSPFTFYRGAAKIMASDLAGTPVAGLDAQLCGDAHLSNFGVYASPERRLVFDLNDFDETLPGPFEYDVKRMAASFTIAARHNGFTPAEGREATVVGVRAYREAMARFAGMRTLEVWYAHLAEEDLDRAVKEAVAQAPDQKLARKLEKRSRKSTRKARSRDSLQALAKLTETVDGSYRIVSQPPVVVPSRELGDLYGASAGMEASPGMLEEVIHRQFERYRATLQEDRRQLLERYEVVDWARKVVGVGSVGTRAFIVLLRGRDDLDPLFLQVKEATRSVLEDHLPPSRYPVAGARVVHGQRLMQAASDIFLGWTTGEDAGRFYYWRQLRDMKGSTDVERMPPPALEFYAGVCGWTLARAHARSGDPAAIAAYLGEDDAFEEAVADFSGRYADQNEQDYAAFVEAVRSGRLDATEGV
ncbi:MAG TPA: DUF2252 domain-containing protein [Nocardioides sp.]|uniref:DUF2252 domain-containing protein n=1 Tax=Nocardioides sp. TaxID=35761 RepID=UPI002D0C3FC2|nr:DUF2252 domain-containing protein [Nocardioides sp.]HQR28001.1 DUF2252 domain-containing protein [Nocardioides sp.]